MKLSIVTTLYQSEKYIEEFYRRASAISREICDSYEIIFVNDGSPDDGLSIAIKLAENDAHVTVVDLSRNFGHHKAMMTGMRHAKGENIYLIDSDLEEDPEWVKLFSGAMDECDCDVVYGVQNKRKGNIVERMTGNIFYTLLHVLTGMKIPANIVTARLMTRRYVDALLQHEEREIFMAGLWHITGFEQRPYLINKKSTSKSTYTLRRKLSLFVNSVTSFSNKPLVAIFYIGILISLVASVYASYIVIHWAFFAKPVSGWTSLMASIWLLGGLIISFIGVVGIYLSKIFIETKYRPYTIVKHIYSKNNE